MSDKLRKSYVFGPILSRRLGNSLGINVLPNEKKVCNFNCVYCECGWNELTKKLNFLVEKFFKFLVCKNSQRKKL